MRNLRHPLQTKPHSIARDPALREPKIATVIASPPKVESNLIFSPKFIWGCFLQTSHKKVIIISKVKTALSRRLPKPSIVHNCYTLSPVLWVLLNSRVRQIRLHGCVRGIEAHHMVEYCGTFVTERQEKRRKRIKPKTTAP